MVKKFFVSVSVFFVLLSPDERDEHHVQFAEIYFL